MTYEARIDTPNEASAEMPASGAGDTLVLAIDSQAEDRASARRVWLIMGGTAVLLVALWFFVHRNDPPAAAAGSDLQAATVTVVVPGRATRLEGEVHLVVLAAWLFLAISP